MAHLHKNWKRVFFIIFAGQAFSMLTSAMVQFSIIWSLTDRTGSAMVLALSSIAAFLPQALLGPFFGALVDRYDRKLIMILADMFIALVSLGLGVLCYLGEPPVAAFYLVLALRSAGTAFHVPAMQSSVPLLAPKEELTRVAGWQQFVFSGANLIGPVLGVSILTSLSIEYVMLADVLGAVIASSCLLFVHIPNPEAAAEDKAQRGMYKEMRYGLKTLMRAKGLFLMSVAVSLMMFLCVPAGAIYPLMVKSHFNGTAYNLAATEASYGTGMILGSLLLSSLGKWGKAEYHVKLISWAAIIYGALLAAQGALPPDAFYIFLSIGLPLGSMSPFFSGPFTAMLQTYIEPSALGRVMSLVNSMILIATTAGLLAAGPVAERMGVPAWFISAGLLVAVLGMFCFLIKPEPIREAQ